MLRKQGADPEAEVGVGQTAGKAETMKQAKENLEKQRLKCRNTVQVVTFFLGNRHNRNLSVMLGLLEKPLLELHIDAVERLSTPRGAGQWYAEMASGCDKAVVGMIKLLQDRSFNCRCGLAHRGQGLAEPEERQARLLGDATLSALQGFVGEEYATMVLFYCRPPEVFAGLLSPDDTHRKEVLKYLKSLWNALEQVEAATSPGDWLRKWLDELLWPTSGVVREVLISLHETSFKSVPPDTLEIIKSIFESHGSSRLIELAFRHATSQTRHNSSGQVCRPTPLEVVAGQYLARRSWHAGYPPSSGRGGGKGALAG